MADPFPVIVVPGESAEATEEMGSKAKFWYTDVDLGKCLFKEGRRETGEDWAEKLAAELAALLGLPHAEVEFGSWRSRLGIVSPSFVPRGARLLHGNELLFLLDRGYPLRTSRDRHFERVPQHTVSRIFKCLGLYFKDSHGRAYVKPPMSWAEIAGISTAAEVFVGYLLLDAWIGNQDRHHENWGIICETEWESEVAFRSHFHLAPTYDHASSLGRNETDEVRQRRMETKDPNYTVSAYVERARSALYDLEDDPHPLTTHGTFHVAARQFPNAAAAWIHRLTAISDNDITGLIARVPPDRMSPVAGKFACRMLAANRSRLVLAMEEFM